MEGTNLCWIDTSNIVHIGADRQFDDQYYLTVTTQNGQSYRVNDVLLLDAFWMPLMKPCSGRWIQALAVISDTELHHVYRVLILTVINKLIFRLLRQKVK